MFLHQLIHVQIEFTCRPAMTQRRLAHSFERTAGAAAPPLPAARCCHCSRHSGGISLTMSGSEGLMNLTCVPVATTCEEAGRVPSAAAGPDARAWEEVCCGTWAAALARAHAQRTCPVALFFSCTSIVATLRPALTTCSRAGRGSGASVPFGEALPGNHERHGQVGLVSGGHLGCAGHTHNMGFLSSGGAPAPL